MIGLAGAAAADHSVAATVATDTLMAIVRSLICTSGQEISARHRLRLLVPSPIVLMVDLLSSYNISMKSFNC